jgi:virulence-associated protein VapD
MNIHEKLQQAREHIKRLDLKKKGYNNYSGYSYYTPEQINDLVYRACKEVGLLTKFDLKRDQFGMYGELTIYSLDDKSSILPELTFTQATDVPKITATNIAQQIGGAVTYTHRYLLMTAFDIVENDLDFDSKNNAGKENDSTGQQGIMIDNLLRTANIPDKVHEDISNTYEHYSFDKAKKCIEYLKENQLPGIENQNPSQTDIKNHLNKLK